MKTYIGCKQHKNSTPKHKTIRTTIEASPWNDQQYKITGGDVKLEMLQHIGGLPVFCQDEHLSSTRQPCTSRVWNPATPGLLMLAKLA